MVADRDVVEDPEAVRSLIGLAGQAATVDDLLTARANLEMIGRLYHLPRAEVRRRAGELLERVGLAGNLAHVRQIPEKLIDVTLQPIMFVLLFAFVFGNVIAVPDGNYREYLLGGSCSRCPASSSGGASPRTCRTRSPATG